MTDIVRLLHEAARISRHHGEIQALLGDSFNVFSVLQVEGDEVRTHSRLLRELLDPKGSHGLGDAPLRLFVAKLKLPEFETAAATVRAEVHAGPKDEHSGGRVDLVVAARQTPRIIIENKIWAGDQENQLLRYRQYAPQAALLYLTLMGDEPSAYSTGANPLLPSAKWYRAISYRHHILTWLEDCRKEAVNRPAVRETLTQYIHLLRQLTNQNPSNKMTEEIVNHVVETQDRLDAFLALHSSANAVFNRIFEKVKSDVEGVAIELGLSCSRYNLGLESKDTSFAYTNDGLAAAGLEIEFGFARRNVSDFYFGFCFPSEKGDHAVLASLQEHFRQRFGELFSDDYYPAWCHWGEWRYWTNEMFGQVYRGTFRGELKVKVEQLLEVFRLSMNGKGSPLA